MAATTVKSTLITNLETVPLATAGQPQDILGKVRVANATVEVATSSIDEVNDVVLFVPVPMNARVLDIRVLNDDLDSNGSPALTVDIGLFHGQNTGTAGGTVIDVDAYASAITQLQAASVTGATNFAFEARNIDKIGRQVWEDGGLTANPGGTAYIGLNVANAAGTAAAGTVTMIVYYVVD